MTRERAIDEFESVFEQAAIPVLDIEEIEPRWLSVVCRGHALDDSAIAIARHLKTRFGASVRVHWPATLETAKVKQTAETHEFVPADSAFGSTAELIGQIALAKSQLVILPESEGEQARIAHVDDLVRGSSPPVLIVPSPIDDPPQVFRRILHSLSGNFRQTENFSYSFALVEEDGAVELFHAIDKGDVESVRETLRIAPTVSDENEAEILARMKRHGERYLKAVVAASRKFPYEVSYQLTLGNVVECVRQELARGQYGLLVVGHHEAGFSHVTAADYQLMHLVRDVPVLAL